MSIPAPRYDSVGQVLHHLLRCAAVGLIHREPDDTVMISGQRANDMQTFGASVLDTNEWLLSWPEADGGTGYCLSGPGTAVLDRWDIALWGAPSEASVRRRPLQPPCLDDSVIDIEARRLIETLNLNDCFHDGTDGP